MMSHNRSITEEEDKKPQIILDYNKFKGGLYTMDHLATNYSCIQNARHWPTTLFFNMLYMVAITSYVMWITFYPESLPKSTAKRKIFSIIYEKKLSPGPWIEPGSPPLRAGAISTKPPRRSTWPNRNIFSYWIPPYPPESLVPSIRDGGEQLC